MVLTFWMVRESSGFSFAHFVMMNEITFILTQRKSFTTVKSVANSVIFFHPRATSPSVILLATVSHAPYAPGGVAM